MIKKRNLDNSLIQWIMTQTGLGPGIGELFYVAPAASSSSQFRTQLQSMDIDDNNLDTTLATAEDKCVAYRNDVVLAMPGTYTAVASQSWSKAHTHLMGLGGPNVTGHFRTSSASDMRNVQFHTVTAQVAEVINVTGGNCQMHNVLIHNEGSHATNYAALKVNKFGFYGKNLHLRGATGELAMADKNCASLYVHTDADYLMMERCVIGHNTYTYGARDAALSGVVNFSCGVTAGPQNGIFRDCYFPVRAETTTVGAVRWSSTSCADRDWIFENCLFTNFWANYANDLAAVFKMDINPPITSRFILRNCDCIGFAEWVEAGADHVPVVVANMPPYDSGAVMRQQTETIYAGADR